MNKFSPHYNSKEVESKWIEKWERGGLFNINPQKGKVPYCIVIPPPNITGSLHMGHALDETLQDILIRFKRMQGYCALWVPGCDHAGIATQNVVEREIAKEGLKKEDLGRDKFIKRIWEWKEVNEERIKEQLKSLGCSCNWGKWAFTFDEKRKKAVREAFVRLYKEGYIYKENYIINWCPRCGTALSDVEVEYKERKDFLYYINYPLIGGGEITVATTRPETMLGDTAVAVHPEDTRYKRVLGKKAILPLVGREIPIVSDEKVDPKFGTGAVKVTPAHDMADFEIGRKHNLETIIVIDKKGFMNENAGNFKGLGRFEAREKIVNVLRKKGYLLKVVDYTHSVGHCYRCGEVIEPYISPQWFVKMKSLAQPAIKAVKKGRVRFIPSRWEKVYINWMENIKDWCISRQIWWGHRIPVWHCKNCGKEMVESKDPVKCKYCGSKEIYQEEDVLDTWFSSGLWPLSALGWPDETKELKFFYPTSTLITGYEIIFFWVARMIMFGLKFRGEVPFRDVYIHPIVRDKEGKKMSKSLGNVIDPLNLIKKYGCDALRMGLASITTGAGQDIFFNEKKFQGMRNFVNKIWNASRFVFMNLKEDFKFESELKKLSLKKDDFYILSLLDRTIEKVTSLLEKYEFSEATSVLYDFFWHQYCDWYIELSKERFKGEDRNVVGNVHLKVLKDFLKLLHPFMPFITEEINEKLKEFTWEEVPSISLSQWPISGGWKDKNIEGEYLWKIEVITSARSLKSEWGLGNDSEREFYIKPSSPEQKEFLKKEKESIEKLVKAKEVFITDDIFPIRGFTRKITSSGTMVYMALEGMDINREKIKLEKELNSLDEGLERIDKKLSNKDFLKKAPKNVVEKYYREKGGIVKRRERIMENLENLKGG